MSAPVLSRPLSAQAGRRPIPPKKPSKARIGRHAPPPFGGVPSGGPQGAARREGRFPLAGSRGTGPRGRGPPRPRKGTKGYETPPLLPSRRVPPVRKRAPGPGPQSQSFSRGYGSVLPTSLTYFVPSARGSSPWRPDAVVGTAGREHDRRPLGFQGPVGDLPNAPKAEAPCQPSGPLPGRTDSGAVRTRPASGARDCQGGKRTLLGAPTGVPRLPRVTASARPPPRSGDLDPVPFRPAARPPSLLAKGRGATAAERERERVSPPSPPSRQRAIVHRPDGHHPWP